METDLHARRTSGTDTVIVTGGETDVCVLRKALCSSTEEAGSAANDLYHIRYGMQAEAVDTKKVICYGREGAAASRFEGTRLSPLPLTPSG